MDLRVDDQHLASPFDPKILSCPRIRRSLKSADSAQAVSERVAYGAIEPFLAVPRQRGVQAFDGDQS
jgi:hypothetical protein